jgi:predicted lysophospholipase L1 biosynthesis ABC-type transport system permease subunit
VVVISEATARRFWPNRDALGRSVRITLDPTLDRYKKLPKFTAARVIGIVPDVISGFAWEGKDPACLYFPTSIRRGGNLSLLVRVKGDPQAGRRMLDTALTRTAQAADYITPMAQVLALQIYPFRVAFWISALLGGVALLLTLSGIYGVMSYLVSQRTREIGIRMALGATAGGVIRIVLTQAMRLTALGVGVGVLFALGVSRMFASEFVMVNTFDAFAYAGGVTLVAAAAIAAAYLPSRRAARVDPASTLRSD